MADDAWSALLALDEAARRHAAQACPAPSRPQPASRERDIVVGVADRRLRVPIGEVREVLRGVQCSPLPGAAPWLLGTTAARGRAVAVIDAGAWLFDAAPAPAATGPAVLVGDEASLAALRVDALLDDDDGRGGDLDVPALLAGLAERAPGRSPRPARRPPPRWTADDHDD